MGINSIGPGNPLPLDLRPLQDAAKNDGQTAAPAPAQPAPPVSKPLDPLADSAKDAVLQAQEVAQATGASDEQLTKLFQTLIDLLADGPKPPGTKLDV
jgi:hypothetical protein